jgi:CheY-like chemotaxis protein
MGAHEGLSAGARELPLVLVVEDDPETRRLYALTLAAGGFDTEEAHNGFQALDKATAISPDLILSDIAVPGLDGIELCRRLRADPRTAAIPILAVTGHDDRHYPDRARAAGANQVLIKPFAAETLVAEARLLLSATGEIRDRSIA